MSAATSSPRPQMSQPKMYPDIAKGFPRETKLYLFFGEPLGEKAPATVAREAWLVLSETEKNKS